MVLAYTAALILIAALVPALSVTLLRRWDVLVTEKHRPWWQTWQRTALMTTLALASAALAELTGSVANAAKPLTILTAILLPAIYRLVSIGSMAYQMEIIILWTVWIGGIAILQRELSQTPLLVRPGMLARFFLDGWRPGTLRDSKVDPL